MSRAQAVAAELRPPSVPFRKCRSTGKRSFDRWGAHKVLMWAIKLAQILKDEKRRERRAYYCRSCNGWHLTSQEG